MINEMLQKLGAGAAAVILAAFAGGIAFVALAYALFALLEGWSVVGASAVTALVFAAVAAGLAMLIPKVAPRKRELAALKPKLDQRTISIATEAGVAALGIMGDMMLNRRLKRQEKALRISPRNEQIVRIDDRVSADPREVELVNARRREDKALKARKRADKSRQRAEKKLRAVRLKRLTPHQH